MKYKIVILISKSKLQAIDVQEKSNSYISLDGECDMEYETLEDIEEFNTYIKEAYGISCYSDLEITVMVINCSADKKYAEYLFSLFSLAEERNFIDIKYVLPRFIAHIMPIKQNITKCVCVCQQIYRISINQNLQIICEYVDEIEQIPENVVDIDNTVFSQLFVTDGNYFCGDEDKVTSLEKQIALYEKQILDLKEQLKMVENENIKQVKANQSLKKSYTNLQKEKDLLEKKQSLENCQIYRVSGKYFSYDGKEVYAYTKGSVEFEKNDGEIVKEGEIIAKIQVIPKTEEEKRVLRKYNEYNKECRRNREKKSGVVELVVPDFLGIPGYILFDEPAYEYLIALNEGRLFFIKKENANVKKGDAIAIIVPTTYTRQEAMNWYERMESIKNTNR